MTLKEATEAIHALLKQSRRHRAPGDATCITVRCWKYDDSREPEIEITAYSSAMHDNFVSEADGVSSLDGLLAAARATLLIDVPTTLPGADLDAEDLR